MLVVLSACAGDPASDDDPGPGTCESVPADVSGEGTYYNADGTGNCSFDASPADLMVAALNAADYQSAALCGACLAVTGPSGSVTVRVVDQCPGCKHGDLDLSPQAFQKLSPLAAGRIPITWHQVACDVTGPIAYHFKDGANAYWTAIAVACGGAPRGRLRRRVHARERAIAVRLNDPRRARAGSIEEQVVAAVSVESNTRARSSGESRL